MKQTKKKKKNRFLKPAHLFRYSRYTFILKAREVFEYKKITTCTLGRYSFSGVVLDFDLLLRTDSE